MTPPSTFKVHTDNFGRLSACIKHGMYGVSSSAMRQEMPLELANIREGDVVFISEKEVSDNALFGPFYVVNSHPSVFIRQRKGSWVEIDTHRTLAQDIAYWVEFENRKWCLLFDKTLSDKISIVWPYNWPQLKLDLPSWGAVSGDDAAKLMGFAIMNEVEAKEFLKRHDAW
jgi:hypothetical protein